MKGIIENNSKLFKLLEKELNKKISRISEGEDEDTIRFEDGSLTYCIIKFIFDERIKIVVTILDNNFDPTQEINLTL